MKDQTTRPTAQRKYMNFKIMNLSPFSKYANQMFMRKTPNALDAILNSNATKITPMTPTIIFVHIMYNLFVS